MNDPTSRCVIGQREHAAHVGYVCDHHVQRIATMLREIEDEAIHLEIRPSMAISNERSGGGGLASHQAPARIDAIVLRDPRRGTGIPLTGEADVWGWDDTPSVLDVLGSWARLIREERELTPPDRITVTGERGLLSRQLDWACEQLWIDEMYAELAALLKTLQRVNNTIEIPAGTCETLQPDGKLCDGNVWHVLIKPDGKIQRGQGTPQPDDEPGFRCGTCRRVWTGTDAVRLRDRMWREEQERKATA